MLTAYHEHGILHMQKYRIKDTQEASQNVTNKQHAILAPKGRMACYSFLPHLAIPNYFRQVKQAMDSTVSSFTCAYNVSRRFRRLSAVS